jgi:acetyl-CoA C-acetyltransferase
MKTAYVIDAVRTPRGRGKPGRGALAGIHPQELLAQSLVKLAERTAIERSDIDDVVVGCVSQVGEQGANIARNAVLTAGFPVTISATTLNRFCASGLQAVHFAAMGVMSGTQSLVVAGGVESMSRVPMGSDHAGMDGHNEILRQRFFQVPQGISADLIATIEDFSREDVDHYALQSQKRAAIAIEERRFAKSLFSVIDPKTSKLALAADELPRPDTTADGLAKLEPSFAAIGASQVDTSGRSLAAIALSAHAHGEALRYVHTAGNSSGLADGAAAVLLASEDYVRAHGLKPRARIRAMATVGTPPVIMLTGPTPASQKALAAAGMTTRDVDLWEINEAFASVVLQTQRALDLDPDRVNVNGGAIALGHPLGATGAMLVGTLIDELERRDKQVGVVTMCIGGGQGIATVVERVS